MTRKQTIFVYIPAILSMYYVFHEFHTIKVRINGLLDQI